MCGAHQGCMELLIMYRALWNAVSSLGCLELIRDLLSSLGMCGAHGVCGFLKDSGAHMDV